MVNDGVQPTKVASAFFDNLVGPSLRPVATIGPTQTTSAWLNLYGLLVRKGADYGAHPKSLCVIAPGSDVTTAVCRLKLEGRIGLGSTLSTNVVHAPADFVTICASHLDKYFDKYGWTATKATPQPGGYYMRYHEVEGRLFFDHVDTLPLLFAPKESIATPQSLPSPLAISQVAPAPVREVDAAVLAQMMSTLSSPPKARTRVAMASSNDSVATAVRTVAAEVVPGASAD
eukprot:3745038-Prymnesium_polylepis.1